MQSSTTASGSSSSGGIAAAAASHAPAPTPPTIEETKPGGRHVHGTHDYPEPLTHFDRYAWDVVIIGAGPAGLMTAASLARFGGLDILVVDERSEPTTAGRADGIQPRTIEVLRNMEPLGSEFVARSAASYERTFWDPRTDGKRGIVRTRRVQSFPTDMEIQDPCTLGLQQGIIEGGFLRDMERHGQRVTRPWRFVDFEMTSEERYPVQVTLERMRPVLATTNQGGAPTYTIESTGERKTIKARYLVGTDGGRSGVRARLEERHGVTFDSAGIVDTLWAALDCVAETDFPDVRKIAAIHSERHGALYIFPRENNERGEPIIRCYTQVNRLDGTKSKANAFEARDKVTADMVMRAVQEIAYPYKFHFKGVEWFTCYPIGQRLVSHYSLPAGEHNGVRFAGHHVFLAGDACHTHSPKAGQGMNTALIDAQALAWRINLVEKGLADRDVLLGSYHDERHATGRQLIDFDAEYAALFSGEIPASKPELARLSAEERKEHFVRVQRRNAAFTTGAGVKYADNALNYRDPRPLGLAARVTDRLEPGARLVPAWATRWVSTTPVRMIHEVQWTAPGGFRIYVCGGRLERNLARLESLARHLERPTSFLRRYVANGRAGRLAHGHYHVRPEALNTGLLNGYADEANPFFHLLLVVEANRLKLELDDVATLGPLRARLYCDDVEAGGERRGDDDGDENLGGLHRKWGLAASADGAGAGGGGGGGGGVVVCRPDGYVGCVVGLEDVGALEAYFAGFLREPTARAARGGEEERKQRQRQQQQHASGEEGARGEVERQGHEPSGAGARL